MNLQKISNFQATRSTCQNWGGDCQDDDCLIDIGYSSSIDSGYSSSNDNGCDSLSRKMPTCKRTKAQWDNLNSDYNEVFEADDGILELWDNSCNGGDLNLMKKYSWTN